MPGPIPDSWDDGHPTKRNNKRRRTVKVIKKYFQGPAGPPGPPGQPGMLSIIAKLKLQPTKMLFMSTNYLKG